jgi:GNAT superfamily N-acetyltransferase
VARACRPTVGASLARTLGLTNAPSCASALMEFNATVQDAVPDQDREAIVRLVVEYNNSKVGPSNGRALFIVLRNEAATVSGGLSGSTSRGWLFIDHLVVPKASRGRGVGKHLVALAEREAIHRGCYNAWLNTFEFQARGFYEKLGYACFGELPDYPPGFSRFFMKKSLRVAASEA